MKEWLSSSETAARLGVTPATLYAYVSRGVIGRRVGTDGRSSEFRRREVEELARSRTARSRDRRGALDITIATQVSSIDDDRLRFRGLAIEDVVAKKSFEQTAEFLWDVASSPWELPTKATVPASFRKASAIERIRIAVAMSAAQRSLRTVTEPVAVAEITRRLIATAATAVHNDLESPTIAGRVAGPRVAKKVIAAVETALVVMADHELATSTLAARVAASTRADVHNVVLAGLGALAGPLHGPMGGMVHRLFESAKAIGADSAVESLVRGGRYVPGTGHKVYQRRDPRVALILSSLSGAPKPLLSVVDETRRAMESAVNQPINADFALGALSFVYGLPSEASESMFSVARMAGWIAHALEEYEEEPLRFRARSLSV